MANVTLQNRTKKPARMLVLHLTKQIAPVEVENRTMEESRDGVRKLRISTKVVPDSIRIPSGGTVEVDEAALGCPEIVQAIKDRDVLVVRPVPAPGPEAGSEDATEARKTRRSR